MSGEHVSEAARYLMPSDEKSAPYKKQRLHNNTGGTESSNSTALKKNAMATLLVADGSAAIRVAFQSQSGQSDQVADTDIELGPGAEQSWWVEDTTQYVYVRASDDSSAYEAWVWTSSPGLGIGLGG
jgi:hypothetical protein